MAAPLTRVGRYEIIDKLGHGGMGTLYLARDPAIERLVAIKLLRDGLDNEELRERFAREARSAGKLRHPNVVTIFDVGEDSGQPFIAMEYIPGETLGEVIRRRQPLSLARKLQLIEDVCAGLEYAHKNGIVHRDIKPANIMVDPEGVVKILDFGIARIAQSGMTQSGMLVGTLNYMSPEQVAGTTVDQRSDVFAVAAVLYEVITYQQAFPGGIHDGIFNRIIAGEPTSASSLVPGLPAEIERILAMGLKKDLVQRYQDLGSMRRDLMRVRQGIDGSAASSDVTMPLKPVTRTRAPETGQSQGTGRRGSDRALLAKRRAAQIEAHLAKAQAEFDAGRFEEAIDACEQAATIDPDDVRALDLLDRARGAIEERQMLELVDQARQQLQRGATTAANDLLERAVAINPGLQGQHRAATEIQRLRRELERARERAELVRSGMQRARTALDEQAFETVIRHANEVLAVDPSIAEAQDLRRRAQEGIKARREQEERDRLAAEAVVIARAQFARGRHDEALAKLRAFAPANPLVDEALEELEYEAEEIARREAEERQRAAEEAARRRAAEEAARQRAAEEAARQRAADEAARRRAEEDAARRKAEAAAAQRRTEEEAARRKAEEDAAQRTREAEAAQRKSAEEAARKRAADEAARRAAEAAAAERTAELEAARRTAELEAVRRTAELDAARRADEEAARKRTIEQAAARQREADAKRRADEEAARRREQEERQAAPTTYGPAGADQTWVRPPVADITEPAPPIPPVPVQPPKPVEPPRPPVVFPPPPKARDVQPPVPVPAPAPLKPIDIRQFAIPGALAAVVLIGVVLAYVIWNSSSGPDEPPTSTSVAEVQPPTTIPAPTTAVTSVPEIVVTPSSTPQTTSRPTTVPTTTSSVAPTTSAVISAPSGNAAALGRLREMRDRAAAAAADARAARAPALASDLFNRAQAREREAERLAAAGRNEPASDAYDEAADQYEAAANQARLASRPSTTTTTAQIISVTPLSTSSIAQVSTSIPPPPPPPPTTTTTAAAGGGGGGGTGGGAQNEEAAIRGVISRYESAYAGLDFNGVKALFPKVPPRLADVFKQYESLQYQVGIQNIQVSGADATASVSVASRPKTRVGSANASQVSGVIRLKKVGGAWIIDEVNLR